MPTQLIEQLNWDRLTKTESNILQIQARMENFLSIVGKFDNFKSKMQQLVPSYTKHNM